MVSPRSTSPWPAGSCSCGDEPLTLRDLLRGSPLDARLAVLSACETAVPGVDLPDEVVSLPTGLLQAGAAGVVGSLWAVSDLSTMVLMARFYALWRSDGLDPPEALRRAQQWVRDTPNGVKRDMCPGIGELSGDHVAGRSQAPVGAGAGAPFAVLLGRVRVRGRVSRGAGRPPFTCRCR